MEECGGGKALLREEGIRWGRRNEEGIGGEEGMRRYSLEKME